jgi:hypothetical protein
MIRSARFLWVSGISNLKSEMLSNTTTYDDRSRDDSMIDDRMITSTN